MASKCDPVPLGTCPWKTINTKGWKALFFLPAFSDFLRLRHTTEVDLITFISGTGGGSHLNASMLPGHTIDGTRYGPQ